MTGQVEVGLAVKKARGTRFETSDQDLPTGQIILCNRSNWTLSFRKQEGILYSN